MTTGGPTHLTTGLDVRDNPTRSRFELLDGDQVIGFAEYHPVRADVVEMPHTVIEAARRGQGLGDVLLRGALAELSGRPSCACPGRVSSRFGDLSCSWATSTRRRPPRR